MKRDPASPPTIQAWFWLGPLLYLSVVGMYFSLRYEGRWSEADSATFTDFIRVMAQQGRVVPVDHEVYANGYTFQVVSVSLLAATGVSVPELQQILYPLLAGMLALPAWLLYYECTDHSARGATLGTMLLFTQPEFLFVVLRSSHEKCTRTLFMLALALLMRSFNAANQPRRFSVYVALFYLVITAFIATNNLLANSFLAALLLTLVFSWLGGWAARWRKLDLAFCNPPIQRLWYSIIIGLIIVYVFTFHAYPPAQHDLQVLRRLGDRIAALFLDVQKESPTNVYGQVSAGWISLKIYFLLSSANWVVLLSSCLLWLGQSLRFWFRRPPHSTTSWVLWLLYAAFAAQGAGSIIADATGMLGGNLQHRIFPSFSILAVAMVAATLNRWASLRWARWLWWVPLLAISTAALLSMLKATNEPMLSNKWTFYRPSELAAMEWTDQHLRYEDVWTEFDERLAVAFFTHHGTSRQGNRWFGDDWGVSARHALLSDVTRLRAARLDRALPVPPDALRIYDNGEVQLYELQPETLYQK